MPLGLVLSAFVSEDPCAGAWKSKLTVLPLATFRDAVQGDAGGLCGLHAHAGNGGAGVGCRQGLAGGLVFELVGEHRIAVETGGFSSVCAVVRVDLELGVG